MGRLRAPVRLAALAAAVLALGVGAPAAGAGPRTEARTPAEVYERKPTLEACMVFVARDLRTRFEADPTQPPATLLLVVDATPSLENEIAAMRKALPRAWEEGPAGLRIGVFAAGVDDYVAPSSWPRDADGGLAALAFLPVEGPKNLHRAVREAAARLEREPAGPRAMLLVTQEGGEGEDDVEATRDALLDAEAACYCVAPEAAFERAWEQTFDARPGYAEAGLAERYHPKPGRGEDATLYHGGETAFGLVPYDWEMNLAQTEFVWVRPPRYPVPSGFGYWSLATLCHTTGGRYFVFDFPSRELDDKKNGRRRSVYEFSRLAQLAPDLRPRDQILRDLERDVRARTIVRIWEHLADEARPIVGALGTLERRGALLVRPARPIRSASRPPVWLEDIDAVRQAEGFARDRIRALDEALGWWEAANAKARPTAAERDPLLERVEADFQLLGVQLRKVRFHWGEAMAALDSIKPLDVTYRRARIVPRVLLAGSRPTPKGIDLEDQERNARLASVLLAQDRLARRYPSTPWALLIEKSVLLRFEKIVQIVPRETPTADTPQGRGNGKDGGAKPQPKPPPRPPKPPDGPRPGSGGAGPVTGGG